jgi:hypothetical protein
MPRKKSSALLEKGKTMAERTTGRQWTMSSFRHHHIAGHGCVEDDYSERSGCKNYEKRGAVRFPNDHIEPEKLNGEVIIVQEGRKKDGQA